jgi:dTDP-4-amino-4,6-dideoxygalactose transaminase
MLGAIVAAPPSSGSAVLVGQPGTRQSNDLAKSSACGHDVGRYNHESIAQRDYFGVMPMISHDSGDANAGFELRRNRHPDRTRMPLYPFTGSFSYKSAAKFFCPKSSALNDLVCDAFGASAQQVLLGDCGTVVLVYWLEWARIQNGGRLTVALPSFFCADTALAIRDNGVHVVLLELSEALNLSQASVDFAIQQGCQVLLWPNYFGYRMHDQSALKRARENALWVVFDEAHTFPPTAPCSYDLPHEITLFSFGPNKPVPGNGGGGMFFPDPTMASSVNRFMKSRELWHRPTWAAALDDAKSVIRTRVRWASYQHSVRLNLNRDWPIDRGFAAGPRLLDTPFPALNHYQSQTAARRWQMRCEAMPAHSEYVATLQAEIRKRWDPLGVRMMGPTCDVPAIFAVRVPSQFRYSLSAALAAQGIQTTWHYYPLHRLAPFQDCPREPMAVSDQLASEILVLPCQWIHTTRRLMINAKNLETAVEWLTNELPCS